MVNDNIVPRLKLLPEFNRHIFEDRSIKGGKGAPGKVHSVHAMAAVHLFIRAQAHEPTRGESAGKRGLAGARESGHQDAERRAW